MSYETAKRNWAALGWDLDRFLMWFGQQPEYQRVRLIELLRARYASLCSPPPESGDS